MKKTMAKKMAIPGSGQVSLSDLYDEFTGTHSTQEIQLSDYHDTGNAPASGEIQLAADFYGTSNTPAWLGDRGVGSGHYRQGGSQWYTNNMHYRSISSTANTAHFGDVGLYVYGSSAVQGGGRGMWQGGKYSSDGSNWDDGDPNMYYVTIASTGNASWGTDMPDHSVGGNNWAGFKFIQEGGGSNGTTGIINPTERCFWYYSSYACYTNPYYYYNTISSTGGCSVGGQLTTSRRASGLSGPTYVMTFGGT